MSRPPASITEADAKRLIDLVKREGVRVKYQRRPDMPIIEISPDIPENPSDQDIDESEGVLL